MITWWNLFKHVNSFTILDVNECLATPCDANAVCTNTPGSFTCACSNGYSGDGMTCTGQYPNAVYVDHGLVLVYIPTLFQVKNTCTTWYYFGVSKVSSVHISYPFRYWWMSGAVTLWWECCVYQHTWFLHLCLQWGIQWRWTNLHRSVLVHI